MANLGHRETTTDCLVVVFYFLVSCRRGRRRERDRERKDDKVVKTNK